MSSSPIEGTSPSSAGVAGSRSSSTSRGRAWSRRKRCLMALPLSPDYGGFGGGAVDLMGVMEAFGEALVVDCPWSLVMAAISSRGPQQ